MKMTKHFEKRMKQRGISGTMVNVAYMFGNNKKDKIVLTQQEVKKLLKIYKKSDQKQILKGILDKGGITLVEKDNTLITVYNTNYNNNRKVFR